MSEGDRVDISPAVHAARREMFRHGADDPTYAEIMATCIELGELLDSGRADEAYAADCHALAARLSAQIDQQQHEADQREAIWWARHMEG